MYKALIADDEVKVVQLIKGLIHWDKLNLELVGIAHDGIKALADIESLKPDIVITDIRMPGYDGIELIKRAKELNPEIDVIIISGYQQFDYAHHAIKYDVKDYLLKPLKEEEINHTLKKLIDKYDSNKLKTQNEVDLLKRMRKDGEVVRKEFIKRLLVEEKHMDMSLDSIKSEYHVEFYGSAFKAFVIKPDIHYTKHNQALLAILLEKINHFIELELKNVCCEFIMTSTEDRIIALMNYNHEDYKTIRKAILKVLDQVIALRDLYENIYIYFALGDEVYDYQDVLASIKSSKTRIFDKIFNYSNRVIEEEHLLDLIYRFDYNFELEVLKSIVETYDIERFKKHIKNLTEKIITENCLSGETLYHMGYQLNYDLVECIAKEGTIKKEIWQSHVLTRIEIDMSVSIHALFELIKENTILFINEVIKQQKLDSMKPVNEAVFYIEKHYSDSISLELISQKVGFSPTYFSSLFKKEMGVNFLEYVTSVRMKAAKSMLSDLGKSIEEISNAVGYYDVKHFSKQFKKYSGLSPSKFRKLYF